MIAIRPLEDGASGGRKREILRVKAKTNVTLVILLIAPQEKFQS